MNIFILGLRRSGTTVFWETLRQDSRFTCYDEPFNPHLEEMPEQNVKKTRDEFIQLYNRSSEVFWQMYAPITFSEETRPELTPKQRDYIKWILEQNDLNVIDFTRCNFKLQALYDLDPNAFFIQLVRDPAGFVSSHLGCQYRDPGAWHALKNCARLKYFWRFKSHFDGYGMERIVNKLCVGAGPVEREFQLRFAGCMPETSVEKLLSLWKFSMDTIDHEASLLTKKYVKVYTPDFLNRPSEVLSRLYSHAGLEMPSFDLSGIKPPRRPIHSNSPRWTNHMNAYNIPKEYHPNASS